MSKVINCVSVSTACQAIQWDGNRETAEAIKDFVEPRYSYVGNPRDHYLILSNGGPELLDADRIVLIPSDWLVKEEEGIFRRVDDEQFKKRGEPT
jgi:hypothetical protein